MRAFLIELEYFTIGTVVGIAITWLIYKLIIVPMRRTAFTAGYEANEHKKNKTKEGE